MDVSFHGIKPGLFSPIGNDLVKKNGRKFRNITAGMIPVSLVSGMVNFAIQLLAIQNPVPTTFIKSLDVEMMERHWNLLDGRGYFFDSNRFRAPVLFARYHLAADEWSSTRPEFDEWLIHPDPSILAKAGFD